MELWVSILIAVAPILFGAGAVYGVFNIMRKRIDKHDDILDEHTKRLSRQDVVFENIQVNQTYIIQGMEEMRSDIKDIKNGRCIG